MAKVVALVAGMVVLAGVVGGSGAAASEGSATPAAQGRWNSISVDEIGDPDGDASEVLAGVFGGRFAGTWVNHQTDGRRQVALVDPGSGDAEAARVALIGKDSDLVAAGIDIVAMARSLAELEALADEAVRLAKEAGVKNLLIGVDVIENIVDGGIGVDTWDGEALQPLRALIEASDGALVLHLVDFDILQPFPLPANAPWICLVRLSYEVFLGRSPSEVDEQAWARIMASRPATGAGPAAAAPLFEFLVASDEWLGSTVTDLYRQALDRSPDRTGRDFWIGELRRGVRVSKVASSVFGSAEMHARAGGTDQAYVNQLYERILGRSPDGPGLAYWVEQVHLTGLDSVAARFFGSLESRAARVGVLYEKVLGRGLDAGGRAYWSERLLGMDDVYLAIHLATSAEFINRSAVTCDPPPEVILY